MRNTNEKIFYFILKNKKVKPNEIIENFPINKQMIFRHLKKLLTEKRIVKIGSAPIVFYTINKKIFQSRVSENKEKFEKYFLKKFKETKKEFWKMKKSNKIDLKFLLKSSALFSSKIEGNTLDLNLFINKIKIDKNKKKEFDEINDLIKGYHFAKKEKLNEDNLLEVHKIISKKIIQNSRRGKYRKESVGVFSSNGLEYLAVEYKYIKQEMNIFFEEIKILLNKKMSNGEIFFWSSWIHLQFVLIHPFSDGNGRMARILEKWFLAEKIGEKYWFLESEKFYWEHLDKYFLSLKLGVNYWEVDIERGENFLFREW